MSVDVTYHCQGLTTAAIWDHQLCSSTLSTFLLADGNDMHHHSLITMKATLEDAGTTHLSDKGLSYGNICDLTETWYQEAKGVGKWPTHQGLQGTTFYLYPSQSSCPCSTFSDGSNHFQAT